MTHFFFFFCGIAAASVVGERWGFVTGFRFMMLIRAFPYTMEGDKMVVTIKTDEALVGDIFKGDIRLPRSN